MVVLRAPSRFAQAVAVVFVAAVLATLASDFGSPVVGGAAAVLVALVAARLLIRTVRQRVVLDDDELAVHGILASTSVARSSIAEVVEGVSTSRGLFRFGSQLPVVVLDDGLRYELDLLAGSATLKGRNDRVSAQVARLREGLGLPEVE